MPKRFRLVKKGRRRQYFRKKKWKIPRQVGIASEQQIVTMRYADRYTLSSNTVGVYDTIHFRANDLYDPDYQTGGHQPRGFDEWMKFYDNFIVLGSKITIFATNTKHILTNDVNSDAFQNVMVTVSCTEDIETHGGQVTEILETRKNRYRPLNTYENNTQVLVHKYSAKKMLGLTDVKDHAEIQGSALASPIQTTFYNISAIQMSQAVQTSAPIGLIIRIDYIVMLRNRKQLVQS